MIAATLHTPNKKGTGQETHTKARAILESIIAPHTEHDPHDIDSEDDEPHAEEGTFILDSAAHPTHTSRPLLHVQRISQLKKSIAANNHITLCTHAGTIQTYTNRGYRIRLREVTKPQYTVHPSISARSRITKMHGNIRQKSNHTVQNNAAIGTALWHSKVHSYAWKPRKRTNKHTVRSARTIARPYSKRRSTTTSQDIGSNNQPQPSAKHHQMLPAKVLSTRRSPHIQHLQDHNPHTCK